MPVKAQVENLSIYPNEIKQLVEMLDQPNQVFSINER